MGQLTFTDVKNVLRGMEYKFKNMPLKASKSEGLNEQLKLREDLLSFAADESNVNKTFFVHPDVGELFIKKLEYTFKKKERNQVFINKLRE